ncbi:MAG TPA: ribonuclease P protein component [Ferruginibacter sp.]|nr:ribonuclease P protein component [Ferruginibacter sp.]HRO17734.1 ribonuclease P protein component [Ferruginibacter sp.]HRQ21482.1 ribonuclease P protein component [Ferruginibacter sp.]
MNLNIRYTYRRHEKLKSRKEIDALFLSGNKINRFPIKIWYQVTDGNGQLKAGVGASKKFIRMAHQRNRAKRLLREAYRLQKPLLQAFLIQEHKNLQLFCLYHATEVMGFEVVYQAMEKSIQKLIHTLRENH